MKLDIQTTQTVHRSPIWKFWRPSVAIAQGTKENGLSAVGIGSSLISEDRALDKAVENLKSNAREFDDFSYAFSTVEGKGMDHRIEFLDNKVEKVPEAKGLKVKVEVLAEKDGRQITAQGKPGNLNWGIGSDYGSALRNALEDVNSQFGRTGVTEI